MLTLIQRCPRQCSAENLCYGPKVPDTVEMINDQRCKIKLSNYTVYIYTYIYFLKFYIQMIYFTALLSSEHYLVAIDETGIH